MERYIWNPGTDQEYLLFYCEFQDHNTKEDKYFISWMQGVRGRSYSANKDDVLRFQFFSEKMNIFDKDAEAIMAFLNDVKKIDIDRSLPCHDDTVYLWRLDYNGYKFAVDYESVRG